MTRWSPHLTVAAVVERGGRFLLVEERSTGNGLVINQPAGHVDDGESLIDAVIRETLEETRWEFQPDAITGIYRWLNPHGDTYLRVAFSGALGRERTELSLDPVIARTLWLAPEQLDRHTARSPMVRANIDDYLGGRRYPLDLLNDL